MTLFKNINAFVTGAAITLAPVLASAAEATHGESHSSGGLPQFDPTWFPAQVFWLAITFALMFMFFRYVGLPSLSSIKEKRDTKIQFDLQMAEDMQQRAASLRDSCEAGLAFARGEASSLVAQQEEAGKKTLEAALKTFREKADKAINAAETEAEANRTKLMSQVEQIAADIANEAVTKIMGQAADAGKTKQIVQQLRQSKEAA